MKLNLVRPFHGPDAVLTVHARGGKISPTGVARLEAEARKHAHGCLCGSRLIDARTGARYLYDAVGDLYEY